jgi:hypothetical protein
MLKLVAPSCAQRRQPSKRGGARNRLPTLQRKVKTDVEIGNAVQRVIARGRRGIIDAHGRLQDASTPSASRARAGIAAADTVRAPELVLRLTGIHQRLLFFSASVELEMDRLEVVRAEIERVIGETEARRT